MATKSIYYDPTGKIQAGYNINNQFYTDAEGKNRVAVGSQTQGDDGQWYQLTDNGGVAIPTNLSYVAQQQLRQQQQQQQTTTYAPVGPQYQSPQTMGLPRGDQYGLKYDMDAIKGILNNATQAQYAAEKQGMAQTENQFYNNLMNMQSTTLDSLRRNDAAAIATGASRGMSAASELSSMLGLQQLAMPEATNLANQRNQLVAEEQAAIAKNSENALNLSNEIKQAIANIDLTKYGYDVQNAIGILDYMANQANVEATKYSSDKTLEGVKYNADQNLAGTQYTSDSYQKNSGGGGYTGGGSGGYTSTGGSPAGSPTAPTTPTPPSSTAGSDTWTTGSNPMDVVASRPYPTEDAPLALSNSTRSSIFYDPDSSKWFMNTFDEGGSPIKRELSSAQKRAVTYEGTEAVLKDGYAAGVLATGGYDFKKTYKIGGKTYTYDAGSMLWKDPKGAYTATRTIKYLLDKEKRDAGKVDLSSDAAAKASIGWVPEGQKKTGMVYVGSGADGTRYYTYPDSSWY